MRRDRGILVALFVGGMVVQASAAHAQSEVGTGAATDAAPNPSPRSVDVTIVGGGNEADPLMDTVRELCGRLNLTVTPHFIGDPQQGELPISTDMSVRIDLASRYEASITVHHGRAEVRRTISRNASPSIVREELADAVRSAVEAQLLLDEPPPAPPPEPVVSIAPPPPPAPLPGPIPDVSPPKTADRRFALDLTMLAGGGPVATDAAVVARVGGGVVFASRFGRRPSLTLTASYAIPFQSSFGANVTSQTDIVSIRAVPAIEIFHSSWIALGIGAGGGVDVITLQPTAATQPLPPLSITVNPVQTQTDPIVTAVATAEVGLAAGVAFTLVVGSDFDLVSRRYFVGGAANGQDLVPWRVRPVALAGFTFTAVGAGLFASRSTP